MLRWMAPFLSFTAEEAWKVFGPKGSASIFVETYSDTRAWADAGAAREVAAHRAQVRAESNRQIEALRAEGKLGSSLQAEVTVARRADDCTTLLGSLGDDLRFVLITSAAAVEALPTRPTPTFQVEAAVSGAAKCERCWHYRDDVGIDPAHPTICGRCTSNLFGAGEPRAHRLMAARRRRLALALARHRRGGDRARPDHQDADHRAASSSTTCRTVTPFFDIVRAHNTGAAFSFLAGASGWQRWFFIGLGAVAAVFIVWLLARHGGQRLFCWALALILGGALGNVDRPHPARPRRRLHPGALGQRLLPVVQRRRQRDHGRRGAADPRRAAAHPQGALSATGPSQAQRRPKVCVHQTPRAVPARSTKAAPISAKSGDMMLAQCPGLASQPATTSAGSPRPAAMFSPTWRQR